MNTEPKPFAPDQMIRCEECLRANGPTRVNCLYCGAPLPFNETLVNLQKPALRPLEKWEQGYNNILLPSSANHLPHGPHRVNSPRFNLSEADIAEAAGLLKLTADDFARILSLGLPLPLARASTMDEASLVQRRLSRLRVDTVIVSDVDLGVVETPPVRVRAIVVEPAGFIAYQTPEATGINIAWSSLVLAVVGRLVVRRVELREQKTTRAENRILDANEFFTDEFALEFYTQAQATPYRINANSFDFSCLGARKSLVAGENLVALVELFREHAPQLERDDSYNSARKALEAVWPSERQNEAGGWRRDRPGKYSIGSATEISNEMQFLRYSRLRHYFGFRSMDGKDEDA
ncbi:MAG: hypothetical protein H7Z16_00045 [Pyrinomonadaceae bacterium]|nr:hypothetical protein [Pyrinomonadaceae bacterium]